MRIRDLRDWRSCLESIRQRLDYSNFKAAAGETEEEDMDRALALSGEIDEEIAEGMLHTVISLPLQEASLQLEQFAAELKALQPDPTAETASGFMAEAYKKFCNEVASVQRGLPAVAETFKAYAEGRYDLNEEPLEVLDEAQRKLSTEPQESVRLVGEAACLILRGVADEGELWAYQEMRQPNELLSAWIDAVANVVDAIVETLEEFPLGEVELARDQRRAPDDEERIEYKRGKLVRLGIVEPEVQELLLALLSAKAQRLSGAERKAIVAAGPKVVGGLIAIAADLDSQMQSSISGGEAAIRAVGLLGDMRAEEAVPTLLDILKNTDWLDIIHDRTLQVLHDQMPDLAFDMALDIFDHTTDVELKTSMCGILANGGRDKPGVFERLIEYLHEEESERDLIAGYLADLGDPRALPDLHEAFGRANDWMNIAEIEDAIVRLGGELSAAEKRKSQRLRAQIPSLSAPDRPPQPTAEARPAPVRVTKIGRNEPCPCGSGKKYKKCCGR